MQENSSAKLQGIQENDVILKINDEDVENNIEKLIESINENENKELRILVRRNNEEKRIYNNSRRKI